MFIDIKTLFFYNWLSVFFCGIRLLVLCLTYDTKGDCRIQKMFFRRRWFEWRTKYEKILVLHQYANLVVK